MMKNLIAAGFLLSVSASGAATIAKSVIRQNWPYDPTVTIDYELEGALDERVDIDVKLEDSAGVISAYANSFSGDLSNVAPGVHRIVWDPVKAGYDGANVKSLKVSLSERYLKTWYTSFLNRYVIFPTYSISSGYLPSSVGYMSQCTMLLLARYSSEAYSTGNRSSIPQRTKEP